LVSSRKKGGRKGGGEGRREGGEAYLEPLGQDGVVAPGNDNGTSERGGREGGREGGKYVP